MRLIATAVTYGLAAANAASMVNVAPKAPVATDGGVELSEGRRGGSRSFQSKGRLLRGASAGGGLADDGPREAARQRQSFLRVEICLVAKESVQRNDVGGVRSKDDVPGTSEAHDMPAGLLPVHVQKRVAGTTATRAPPAAVGRPPGGRYRGYKARASPKQAGREAHATKFGSIHFFDVCVQSVSGVVGAFSGGARQVLVLGTSGYFHATAGTTENSDRRANNAQKD
ncbi:uncharacterized protein Triagg1_2020 [Trichoderma aggressivum f. europaeum]|uniref:Uncharacterized protein n=1 Tax=Trichoderma aggressivum f. europaeum TaxID=173218 RepID=A0AAE1IIE9_9HYPO|nr:hypothetical protein Triagg1_2020 [Trichoderma aggressivum f. europaeum]